MSNPVSPLLPLPQLSIALWISLGTVPVLLVILGSQLFYTMLQEVGQISEEVFRGERLPILHIRPREYSDSK